MLGAVGGVMYGLGDSAAVAVTAGVAVVVAAGVAFAMSPLRNAMSPSKLLRNDEKGSSARV